MSKELLQYIENEKEAERKQTTDLMAWLATQGRLDDIVKASQDDFLFDRLLSEFLSSK